MVSQVTQLMLSGVVIGEGQVFKIGFSEDSEADFQLPESFSSGLAGLENSEIIKLIDISLGAASNGGSFHISASSEGDAFKIIVKNNTGVDIDNLILKISRK